MAVTACPFCFRQVDSSRLAYQCAGRGNIECQKSEDDARVKLTGSRRRPFHLSADQKGGGIVVAGRNPSPARPAAARPGAGPARSVILRSRSTSSTPRAR